jgi:hypothetical protein
MGQAGFPEMHLVVDHTGHQVFATCINDLVCLNPRGRTLRENFPDQVVLNENGTGGGFALINDQGIGYQDGTHIRTAFL